MMHIYLCEDDKKQLDYFKDIIEKFLIINDNDLELYCWTSSPSELLSYQYNSDSVGIYFLDVDLNSSMNGLQLAERIRQRDPRGYIIFITVHNEAAPLIFKNKLEAMDFIVKDQSSHLEKRIVECLQCAMENHKRYLHTNAKLLTIKSEGTLIAMDQDDICYITTGQTSHHLIIHCLYSIRQITGSLKLFASCLGDNFCYCNRSTIINLDKVDKYIMKERLVFLVNGEECSVSFRMAGKLNQYLARKKHR
jgi:two-component system response regulator AgrA